MLKGKLAQDAIQPEIRDFYFKCLTHAAELLNLCTTLTIKQGMHQPLIHIPRNSDFATMMSEVLIYAEDTGNLLIKYHMLDKPPLVSEPVR